MRVDRRTLLAGGLALAGSGATRALATTPPAPAPVKPLSPAVADLEKRTFAFLRDAADPATGLVRERSGDQAPWSIAATGQALALWPVGVARGWITRAVARDRTLAALRFLDQAPSGDDRTGHAGHRGFFYATLDRATGQRAPGAPLSSGATATLHMGMLVAASWFDANDPGEMEIGRLAYDLVERTEWPWFQRATPRVSQHWTPEQGFGTETWAGYGAGMSVYLLGLGAIRNPLSDDAWSAWTAGYPACWRGEGETRHLAAAPLTSHHESQLWIDFRGLRDAVMRGANSDYHENTRRAAMANRAYCLANPEHWRGYEKHVWGLGTCDGPGPMTIEHRGASRALRGHGARGPLGQPDGFDDGTIAPAAAAASIAFVPELAEPAIQAMRRLPRLYGRHGFPDAFNPTLRDRAIRPIAGTIEPRLGWMAPGHRAAAQASILAGIANHRDEFIWRRLRAATAIRRGLERAGFVGGWLAG